jgi:hypothetical protein
MNRWKVGLLLLSGFAVAGALARITEIDKLLLEQVEVKGFVVDD